MSLSETVKFKPDDDKSLHAKILKGLHARLQASRKKMSEFGKQWNDADDSMRAYIHARDIDKQRKAEKDYEGKMDFVTLEVPYAYATVMTAHTYFSSVMLSRSPLWQFTGRHGESQDSIFAVEAVMDYQRAVGGHLPPLYHFLYDLAKYSVAVGGTSWEKQEKIVSSIVEEDQKFMGISLGTKKKVRKEERLPGFQGNKIYNIRPYDFRPDPRVALWKFQEGEFCGRETSLSYAELIAEEHSAPGTYINLEQLKKLEGAAGKEWKDLDSTSRVSQPLQPGEENIPGFGFFKASEMYIKLIPRQWGLGNSERMEIWQFIVVADKVVIKACPLGLYHHMFPYFLGEGNFGSEEFAKFGMLEIMRPLTDVLTWLVNSHFYNVRRVLNNQLVVDPSRITMKDLTKPGQRIMRLKPSAYGTDARMAVHQLVQTDVTRSHLGDSQYIEQMIHKVTAVTENVLGVQQSGGRKSATEVRQAGSWSTNRLKTPVEYNSALAFDMLCQQMLSNTQQLLDVEQKYAMAGSLLDTARAFVDVNASKIAGAYDFVMVDGTLPVDRLAQANFWKELVLQMSRDPMARMSWDVNSMIAHTMKMQGERNIDRFKIKIGSPEQLQQQAQMGNIVPIGGAGGGRGKGPGGTGASGGSV